MCFLKVMWKTIQIQREKVPIVSVLPETLQCACIGTGEMAHNLIGYRKLMKMRIIGDISLCITSS